MCWALHKELEIKCKLDLFMPLHAPTQELWYNGIRGQRKEEVENELKVSDLGLWASTGAIYRRKTQREDGNNEFSLEHLFFTVPAK